MLKSEGFDSWEKDYDGDVKNSEENNPYPFAGYARVLGEIHREITAWEKPSVLDLGFGTGKLTARLYDAGCRITGVDFSQEMIEAARSKMPQANLIRADFTAGLPLELHGKQFDFIVGTYAFHHVPYEKQADFFRSLAVSLSPGGKILIGDIMFQTEEDFAACRREYANVWDEEEAYPIVNTLSAALAETRLFCKFRKLSFCSGVLAIQA